MLEEMHLSNISTYAKTIDPEYAAQIAEFEEEVGVTDLDAPDAPKRKTPRTDAQLRELEGIERKKAEKRAQAEHQAALARLNNGTAVLRQKSDRTPLPTAKPKIAKVAKKTAKPAKNVAKLAKKPAKAAKPVVKKPRKPYYHKPGRLIPSSQVRAKARRKAILETLQAGKFVPMQPKQIKKGEIDLYQQQRAAVKKIEKAEGLTIVRIKRIQDGKSFWALDNFKRHEMDRAITGRLDDADRIPLITAITSGEIVLASDIKNGTRIGVSSTAILARNHGMNIYTVFSGKYVLGWVLIDESDKTTPAPILEAAYREFKRVAKDAGTTISGVLAVKGGQ